MDDLKSSDPPKCPRNVPRDTALRLRTAWALAATGWVMVGVFHVTAPRLPVLTEISVGMLAALEIAALVWRGRSRNL